MNANELANLLEVDSWYKLVTREEIATMLRQQQEQIDKLTAIVALREMEIEALKAKKLTDEEIVKIHNEIYGWDGMADIKDFARAILRKAQKK
jgi:hypothetical protein